MSKEKICEIISKEWTMFTNTKGIGGRAPCQDDANTFINARTSWWSAFPPKVINSYYEDLQKAILNNRNLITLKYAYMMESTDYQYFKQIEHLLPEIAPMKRKLVDKIVELLLEEEESLRKSDPDLFDQNRPLYSSQDRKNRTSVETYTRGELLTYSYITLELILKYIHELHADEQTLLKKQLTRLQSKVSNHKRGESICNANLKKLSDEIEKHSNTADMMNLELAEKIATIAQKEAMKMGKAFVISIYDTGNNLVLLKKMDGAILASIEISQAKAMTAMAYKMSTLELSKIEELKPLQTWHDSSVFGYCYLGGGRVIKVFGKIIGSIGISGGSVEEDDLIAQKCSEF